ncbi:acetolactate synthase small subunit [Armatimonas rosea]|jgi:acetolactate synthase I/III small subunit|uniref:Acetolactate synthase small subunit n=1 Tax=Armatimonas rosea TaxID=685828 RepID=A0A7W9SPN4_ARMRO|nr:acetolactate synthase small subunit [Armatimonas rosea]MBB6050501.1 acetolactate synthase-1/3 small subunit [Armatimonas rosea]
MTETHTITVLVENRPGVLARVSGLFARRGYNIESLTVSITDDPNVSRMTLVVGGDSDILEQITKQLHKLVDVLKVYDYVNTPMLERELALIKVTVTQERQMELIQLVTQVFGGKIIDTTDKAFVVEVTGGAEKIDAFEKLMESYGIRELVRTGRIALMRGARTV